MNAKPFVKWVGGKGQLLLELEKRLPPDILENKIIPRYIEPFVGGGAVFFFLKTKYKLKESYLFDNNQDLIIAYEVIKNNHHKLIKELREIENDHLKRSEEKRKENFYIIRDTYNQQLNNFNFNKYDYQWIERAAYFIFLNKTCYNGLYRQNSKGEFNVPFGRYKNPKICDENNLLQVHNALIDTKLFCGDFTESGSYINNHSLVYMDPPYRPLNGTSYFTKYSKDGFDDEDQNKLANFFKEMDMKGANLILSNSDPKNQDEQDQFFDNLYADFNLERVPAKRNINRDAKKRGFINELIVRNY
ncbi:MAG: Dam family site-specific DNA-(adenine-N6)-methyltransferase [Methanobacterium sp.]|nr:Dam family site-specific DNA-(adenine-N6)-methyltransferase [Methanobacterium sp.]